MPAPDALTEPIESSRALDPPADALARVADAVIPRGAVRSALRGSWLGHPLHPLLTDIPIGFWTGASVLDLMGARARGAASAFVGLGVLSAAPTVASGLAELTSIDDRRTRRVVAVHAGANAVATAVYAWSWRRRRQGHTAAGVVLALAGMGIATVGGYLGGHLAFGTDAGEDDEPSPGRCHR
jgi:uncharacterized membrane protein